MWWKGISNPQKANEQSNTLRCRLLDGRYFPPLSLKILRERKVTSMQSTDMRIITNRALFLPRSGSWHTGKSIYNHLWRRLDIRIGLLLLLLHGATIHVSRRRIPIYANHNTVVSFSLLSSLLLLYPRRRIRLC
jgi:hypothetical protein